MLDRGVEIRIRRDHIIGVWLKGGDARVESGGMGLWELYQRVETRFKRNRIIPLGLKSGE